MLWKSGLIITGLLASIACGFPADFKLDDSNVSPIREKRSSWTDDGVSDRCPKVYDFVEDPVLEAEIMKCYRRVQEKLARGENELRNGRYSTTETPDDATTIGVEVTSLK
ncbi:uncharacterized protein LOC107225052 [Neodiprion lecontei]|uniref:Uncharacterized protein LOC107225052 n=1 Tax=Neodiprion lecontei TaxID=441921 RepID=A0A6J0C0S9_NEOLC|nr:uncharacterized protein LOC107225052 [Neodiprion lecontei]XP_046472445.1 uncharacterized protein LOC124214263 [Neodiprion pinetum]